MSDHLVTRFATVTPSHAGMDSASDITPGPLVLEKFGLALEAAGIRGQLLAITDIRGIQHKHGPSRWQQRRYRMERNLADNNAKGNSTGAAKWVQELYDHEHTDFDFDFGATGPDVGATGTSSPMRSGGVTGAAEGCSARGAPSGTVVGTAGGLAQNAASSASGGMGGDGAAVAAVADLGATGAASPTMSGGAAGAAAGGLALGAPSGAVLGAAGGSAHNAASSA